MDGTKLVKSAGRPKPPAAGKGRVKGTPNKATAALKEMILGALDDQQGGGRAYLKRQATENPTAFMTLLGKVLPTTLAGTGPDGAIKTTTRIELAAFRDDTAS